ncbi:MAG: hypothetical protein GC178_02010 [Flavobacteriales bacterium]|nr:hypothetical protein [Flavobacteriales bacterium]
MLDFLKDHPFAVDAYFDSSIVLTFAFPKDQLQPHIPECLELDTFEDKWAFVAVAMVQTRNLRPKGFPKFFGNDFFLIGYRIFVRYTTQAGKNLRGLYIIRSETDQKKMEFFGNLFTHYNYTTTDIELENADDLLKIHSEKSRFHLEVSISKEDVELPSDSPFKDWKEARRFAGPLPFTFTYDERKKEVLIIEGVRQNWKPKPIEVVNQRFGYIDGLGLNGKQLANAFIITEIPYSWKKGRKEKWNG